MPNGVEKNPRRDAKNYISMPVIIPTAQPRLFLITVGSVRIGWMVGVRGPDFIPNSGGAAEAISEVLASIRR